MRSNYKLRKNITLSYHFEKKEFQNFRIRLFAN